MTLAASSQRSQIIRSKFRSVLQLRIHRRNQEQISDPDPWISASGPPLAPALPSGTAPFLFSPGVLLPEPEYCPPWRSPKKESPKISQRWRESKPRGNLTYHQYMPPEPRQGSRADPQAEGSALGPPGPPLWEGTESQQPHPRMKPCVLTPCPPGVPSPSPPPHKLELQTLKLEELTRERPKPRREDTPAGAPWPRLRPKALAAALRQGSVKPSAASHRPPLPRAVDTQGTAPAPTTTSAPAAAPALNPSSAPVSPALTLEEELQEAIRRAQV
ncbi:hypothetical protein EGM_09943, partial [Macaca fascicularis]